MKKNVSLNVFVIKSQHRGRLVQERRIDGKRDGHDRVSKSIFVIPFQT